jgi:hypothetical protein
MAYGIIKVDNITFDDGGSDQNVTVSGLYRATTSGVTVSGTIAAATVSGVTVIGSTTVSGATVTGTTANFTSGNFSNIISSAATMSGALIMANQQQVRFREAVGNGVNHIALQAPAIVSADQTITLPDETGTVVTTGDNGSVTSTMILDGTILNVDINASAGIVDTKLATIATAGKVSNSATTATNANTASAIVARDASGDFTAGTITAALTGAASSNVLKAGDTMTGALVVPLASAATPSLTFTSDLNTGIYSPGADQVAISTNGTQRALFDATGNIFLSADAANTGAASAINFNVDGLEACDINNAGYLRFNKTNFSGGGVCTQELDSALNLGGGNNTINNGLNLSLSGPDRVSATGYQMRWNTNILYQWDKTSDFHAWSTGTSNERMRLDSNGRLGLGTSSPTFNLVSANNTTDGGWLYSSGSVSTLGLGGYSLAGDGAFQLKYDRSTGAITFNGGSRDTPVERARIDSSGSLLVGTSSSSNFIGTGFVSQFQVQESTGLLALGIERPTNDTSGPSINFRKTRATSAGGVTVVQNGDNLAELRFSGTDGTGSIHAAGIIAAVDGTPGTNDMPGRLVFSTTADGAASPTERLRITSAGNVGIGTTTPSATLDVYGDATLGFLNTVALPVSASGGCNFRWNRSSGSAETNIYNLFDNAPLSFEFLQKTGASTASTLYLMCSTDHIFYISNAERARIDSSGRLLAGTSTSIVEQFGGQAQLQAVTTGSYAIGAFHYSNDVNECVLTLGKSRSVSAGGHTIVQNGDSISSLRFEGSDGTGFLTAAQIAAQVDGTPGTNDMPGRLVFSVTADGAASPTEALRISNDRSITVSDGGNVILGTTTGTKIGTGTTQKLGFYNATPVVQPTAVADATDAVDVITQLNALLTRMRNLGLIAT